MSDNLKINLICDQELERIGSVRTDGTKHWAAESRPAQSAPRPVQPRPKKGRIKKFLASIFIIIVITFAVFSSSIIFSNENLIKSFTNLNFLSQLGGLITSSDKPLRGEENDRINFLLTGIGGGEHEGGTLADTIILATYKPSTKQIAMMSLPRDMYVKIDNKNWSKINAINAYAEAEEKGSGGEKTAKFVSNLLSTPIDYYAVIDFDGFQKLIDEFGGIDVYVDNDLIDYSYPIQGKENDWPIRSRYETLNIKKGWQHFDGAMALKYSRSRHALGVEGSDFARSKRQQKVLVALKAKIEQFNFVLNPTKISSLMNAFQQNASTNLQMWEILKLAKIFKEIDTANPINYSLVDGHAPLLYDQIVNGAYILLPYGGNYDQIKFVWDNIYYVGTSTPSINTTKWAEFKDMPTSTSATTTLAATSTVAKNLPVNKLAETAPFSNETDLNALPIAPKESSYQTEGAKIEIQNGTTIEGWASKEANRLRAKGFTVIKTGNAATKGYGSIKIYDFSGGKYLLTISELQIIYGVSASVPPSGLRSAGNILIILGQ